MFRLSQIAAPAVVGAALLIGAPGCTHDRADEIPSTATELSTGQQTVSAVAPHDGTFYVWDQNSNKMLYVGKVDKGETVRVDAKKNEIFLDDKVITKRDDLINDHHYKIFFDQKDYERERDHARTLEERSAADRAAADRAAADRAAADRAAAYRAAQQQPAQSGGTTVVVPNTAGQNGTTVVTPNANVTTPSNSGTTVVVPPPAPAR